MAYRPRRINPSHRAPSFQSRYDPPTPAERRGFRSRYAPPTPATVDPQYFGYQRGAYTPAPSVSPTVVNPVQVTIPDITGWRGTPNPVQVTPEIDWRGPPSPVQVIPDITDWRGTPTEPWMDRGGYGVPIFDEASIFWGRPPEEASVPSMWGGGGGGGGGGGAFVGETSGQRIIQRGETLTSIARGAGIAVADLLAANPGIVNPNMIFAGSGITMPSDLGAGATGPLTTGASAATAGGGVGGRSPGAAVPGSINTAGYKTNEFGFQEGIGNYDVVHRGDGLIEIPGRGIYFQPGGDGTAIFQPISLGQGRWGAGDYIPSEFFSGGLGGGQSSFYSGGYAGTAPGVPQTSGPQGVVNPSIPIVDNTTGVVTNPGAANSVVPFWNPGTTNLDIPDVALAGLPGQSRSRLEPFLEELGFAGLGNVGRYGERTFAPPGGPGTFADIFNPAIFSAIADPTIRAWLEFLFGQGGLVPATGLPGA